MATANDPSTLPKPIFLSKSQRNRLPPVTLSYPSPAISAPPPTPAACDRHVEIDLADIRSQYLGPTNPKKRRLTSAARFNFSWPDSDDTSDLSLGPTAHAPLPLCGSGLIAGIDRPLLKSCRSLSSLSPRGPASPPSASSSRSHKPLDKMTERDFRILTEDLDISIKGCRSRRLFRCWPESGLSSKLLEAVSAAGYDSPTPIQMAAIPIGLDGRDLIGTAKTGSGKTAAFVLPMIHYISKIPPLDSDSDPNAEPHCPHAVILAPTRELALQIETEANKFAECLGIKIVSIVGGRSIEKQGFSVYRGCDIVIATPGRLLDCLERRYIVLNRCNYLVLDEADRMIDMGFEQQVVGVLDAMPSSNTRAAEDETYRTTMMFSATMPLAVERLAKKYLRDPITVTVGSAGKATDLVTQRVLVMKENEKLMRLNGILHDIGDRTAIVFVNMKNSVDTVARNLDRLGHRATTVHGGKSQEHRERNLERFKSKKCNVLVATDVVGRGIDIPDVSHVINYDMPKKIEMYTHRIGRTGRAGKRGTAITFLTMNDTDVFCDLKQMLIESRSPVPPELEVRKARGFKV